MWHTVDSNIKINAIPVGDGTQLSNSALSNCMNTSYLIAPIRYAYSQGQVTAS